MSYSGSRSRAIAGAGAESNVLIEKARRLACGYRNLNNYWAPMLLSASGTRTHRIVLPR